MAAALDDYECVRVTDIGGTDVSGYWLCLTDERFGLTYEVASHCDYWDFLGHFASGVMWPATPMTAAGVA